MGKMDEINASNNETHHKEDKTRKQTKRSESSHFMFRLAFTRGLRSTSSGINRSDERLDVEHCAHSFDEAFGIKRLLEEIVGSSCF